LYDPRCRFVYPNLIQIQPSLLLFDGKQQQASFSSHKKAPPSRGTFIKSSQNNQLWQMKLTATSAGEIAQQSVGFFTHHFNGSNKSESPGGVNKKITWNGNE